jgi:hypothetical protein
MKERLNLTIDGELLDAMKAYAASKEMSVSELVESYFRSVTKRVQRRNILDLVDGLEAPVPGSPADPLAAADRKTGILGMPNLAAEGKVSKDGDLREVFYKGQEKKYGF